jgi:hypothetical protein
VATSPDYSPGCSPDSARPRRGSLDSGSPLDAFAVSLGAAVELFIAARAAEGASPRTLEWYRMITDRAVRRFCAERPVDRIGAAELRAWLLELRGSLSPDAARPRRDRVKRPRPGTRRPSISRRAEQPMASKPKPKRKDRAVGCRRPKPRSSAAETPFGCSTPTPATRVASPRWIGSRRMSPSAAGWPRRPSRAAVSSTEPIRWPPSPRRRSLRRLAGRLALLRPTWSGRRRCWSMLRSRRGSQTNTTMSLRGLGT